MCPCLSSAGSSDLERCRGAGSPLLICWQHFSQWSPGFVCCFGFFCCKGPLLAPVQLFFLQSCFSSRQSHAALPAAAPGGWDYSSRFLDKGWMGLDCQGRRMNPRKMMVTNAEIFRTSGFLDYFYVV